MELKNYDRLLDEDTGITYEYINAVFYQLPDYKEVHASENTRFVSSNNIRFVGNFGRSPRFKLHTIQETADKYRKDIFRQYEVSDVNGAFAGRKIQQAFVAGAEYRQPEIDELKKEIQELKSRK